MFLEALVENVSELKKMIAMENRMCCILFHLKDDVIKLYLKMKLNILFILKVSILIENLVPVHFVYTQKINQLLLRPV